MAENAEQPVIVLEEAQHKRCVVIVNPTKVSKDFRSLVTEALAGGGWAEPTWLETSADDPGSGMAAQAVEAQPDLVIAAGGDGTVRLVADKLAGTGLTLGVVPAGTGNLLARSLGLPLTEAAALEVAFGESEHAIDLIRLTVDDHPAEHFAVMAGTGMDAMIMDETDERLKKVIGPAAYFLAAAKALNRLPVSMEVTVDGQRTRHRRAMICVIGNIGTLTGGLTLIPRALADDGLLDVYVASPHRFTHWIRTLIRLLTFRRHRDDRVDEWQGRKVTVRLEHKDAYQLDGDVVGECRTLVAEVVPHALTVKVPAADDAAPAAKQNLQ